jgi:hypothetical protein
MLLTLYQQSEVFAASRLTSFGDGPKLLTANTKFQNLHETLKKRFSKR